MKNNNYITILGWMFNDLKLNPTEALVYALIYGFCQDKESKFKGSINYISKSLNISNSSVKRILTLLCKKQLIFKIINKENNIIINKYTINFDIIEKDRGMSNLNIGIVKLNKGGMVNLTPNINSINNSINITKDINTKKENLSGSFSLLINEQ